VAYHSVKAATELSTSVKAESRFWFPRYPFLVKAPNLATNECGFQPEFWNILLLVLCQIIREVAPMVIGQRIIRARLAVASAAARLLVIRLFENGMYNDRIML
jgi:hypothetical protein